MEWFGETWLSIKGDYVRVRDMDLQYAFRFGVQIGIGDASSDASNVNDVELSYNRIRNVYHHSGMYIHPDSGANVNAVNRPVIKYNLIADNGYESTGAKVPAIPGDPDGGGNSSGISVAGPCSNQGQQYCFDGVVKYNIVVNPANDCINNSGENFTYLGNILVACGPEGNKGLQLFSAEANNKLIGNFALQDGSGMAVGFELRSSSGLQVVNNMNLYSTNIGFDGFDNNFPVTSANNVSAFSTSSEFTRYNAFSQSDWDGDSSGDPLLEDCAADLAYNHASYMDTAMDALDRLYGVYSQFANACRPVSYSPLLDSGEVVSGVHCATADDDPQTPQNPSDVSCLHWLGSNPDRGPFERGFW